MKSPEAQLLGGGACNTPRFSLSLSLNTSQEGHDEAALFFKTYLGTLLQLDLEYSSCPASTTASWAIQFTASIKQELTVERPSYKHHLSIKDDQ